MERGDRGGFETQSGEREGLKHRKRIPPTPFHKGGEKQPPFPSLRRRVTHTFHKGGTIPLGRGSKGVFNVILGCVFKLLYLHSLEKYLNKNIVVVLHNLTYNKNII